MSGDHGYFPPGDIDLLLVVGADDQRRITSLRGKVTVVGTSDIYGLLQGPAGDVPFHRLQMTPRSAREPPVIDWARYRTIVNLITEPEGNRRVLGLFDRFTAESNARIINRAEAVLQSTRDEMARLLDGVPGLIVPRVTRVTADRAAGLNKAIAGAGLSFPLIIRTAGSHTGRIVGRFDDPASVPARAADKLDHLATEFVDFASADGLYRKYRVWFMGNRMLVRHLFISDHWNVHGKDRQRFMAGKSPIVAEERAMFVRVEGAFEPAVVDTLRAARSRISLDFFGIDFAIARDGHVLLFEANASMNFFPYSSDPQFAYLRKSWAPARAAFRALVGAPAE